MLASWCTGLRSRLQPGCLHVGHSDVLMPLPSILGMTHLLHSSAFEISTVMQESKMQHGLQAPPPARLLACGAL